MKLVQACSRFKDFRTLWNAFLFGNLFSPCVLLLNMAKLSTQPAVFERTLMTEVESSAAINSS
ncbi:hypothetical protein CPB83DRAFT_843668 [Crepidotus variabilis]|uniref:Uncharacterized protein n=1 Tax=Crepidotus variabilis TaxID=179855 RepID=A0A9P6EUI6_9AGAR|nr:hypothetical protein CPB83DRAFT_843668 [Crepidotus variabilis]